MCGIKNMIHKLDYFELLHHSQFKFLSPTKVTEKVWSRLAEEFLEKFTGWLTDETHKAIGQFDAKTHQQNPIQGVNLPRKSSPRTGECRPHSR